MIAVIRVLWLLLLLVALAAVAVAGWLYDGNPLYEPGRTAAYALGLIKEFLLYILIWLAAFGLVSFLGKRLGDSD